MVEAKLNYSVSFRGSIKKSWLVVWSALLSMGWFSLAESALNPGIDNMKIGRVYQKKESKISRNVSFEGYKKRITKEHAVEYLLFSTATILDFDEIMNELRISSPREIIVKEGSKVDMKDVTSLLSRMLYISECNRLTLVGLSNEQPGPPVVCSYNGLRRATREKTVAIQLMRKRVQGGLCVVIEDCSAFAVDTLCNLIATTQVLRELTIKNCRPIQSVSWVPLISWIGKMRCTLSFCTYLHPTAFTNLLNELCRHWVSKTLLQVVIEMPGSSETVARNSITHKCDLSSLDLVVNLDTITRVYLQNIRITALRSLTVVGMDCYIADHTDVIQVGSLDQRKLKLIETTRLNVYLTQCYIGNETRCRNILNSWGVKAEVPIVFEYPLGLPEKALDGLDLCFNFGDTCTDLSRCCTRPSTFRQINLSLLAEESKNWNILACCYESRADAQLKYDEIELTWGNTQCHETQTLIETLTIQTVALFAQKRVSVIRIKPLTANSQPASLHKSTSRLSLQSFRSIRKTSRASDRSIAAEAVWYSSSPGLTGHPTHLTLEFDSVKEDYIKKLLLKSPILKYFKVVKIYNTHDLNLTSLIKAFASVDTNRLECIQIDAFCIKSFAYNPDTCSAAAQAVLPKLHLILDQATLRFHTKALIALFKQGMPFCVPFNFLATKKLVDMLTKPILDAIFEIHLYNATPDDFQTGYIERFNISLLLNDKKLIIYVEPFAISSVNHNRIALYVSNLYRRYNNLTIRAPIEMQYLFAKKQRPRDSPTASSTAGSVGAESQNASLVSCPVGLI
ncbi:hypothetical protein NEHOM01_2325 [Nematocida homosporus]|uniref:uncharacterized protein n=1 Tax=Nematocida homosporus TaxID=1912981 RepID=UPI00222052CA|nr:uncharacterized protein NEHOM01_2325 [Nematocida homosporus]KAI5187728.1 hypothetical protein NEHOM01_2325 [Nematocida homosporus]